MSDTGRVLVVGATGRVGGKVAGILAREAVPVRALVRDRGRARALADAGVEIVVGDLGRPETLPDAVAGTDAVFLASSDEPAQHRLQVNLVQAAAEGGVRRIVKLSVVSASPTTPVPLSRWHFETERAIEQSGMSYAHLRSYFFMQSFLAFADAIRADGKLVAPAPCGRLATVDLRDVAAVGAHLLTAGWTESRPWAVSGPEALSFPEVAGLLSEELGKQVVFVPVSGETWREQLLAGGMPRWLADSLVAIYGLIEEGLEETVQPLPAGMVDHRRTVRELIAEHRSAFGAR